MSLSAVEHATYPLPQPLAVLLQAAVGAPDNANCERQVESHSTGLAQLFENAMEALDRLYFGTAPRVRDARWFHHRTCLRLHVTGKSLTVTDLGSGMTRADLINALGIGRFSPRVVQQQEWIMKSLMNKQEEEGMTDTTLADDEEKQLSKPRNDDVGEDQGGDGDDPISAGSDNENEEDGDSSLDGEKDDEDNDTVETETIDEDVSLTDDDEDDYSSAASLVLPCLKAHIGGFYSAVCALNAVGVTIGTKVSRQGDVLCP